MPVMKSRFRLPAPALSEQLDRRTGVLGGGVTAKGLQVPVVEALDAHAQACHPGVAARLEECLVESLRIRFDSPLLGSHDAERSEKCAQRCGRQAARRSAAHEDGLYTGIRARGFDQTMGKAHCLRHHHLDGRGRDRPPWDGKEVAVQALVGAEGDVEVERQGAVRACQGIAEANSDRSPCRRSGPASPDPTNGCRWTRCGCHPGRSTGRRRA